VQVWSLLAKQSQWDLSLLSVVDVQFKLLANWV